MHLNLCMTSALLCRADRSSVCTDIAIMAIKGHVSEEGMTRSLWEEEKDYSDYLTDPSSMIYFQFRALR